MASRLVSVEPIPAPRFSVLIPLEAHRGQALRCVQGWAEEQVFPRERFEIVIASPPGHPPAELDEIRRVLAPQDRLLQFDCHHDMALGVKAAEAARGELLLFTESHCLPEPETLERADAAAELNPDWAGFSCRSVPITHNLLSQIEAESYGRDIEFGVTQHPWRKVLDQCFVVRRDAYFRTGGFDPAFGHFAEWLIAARFYDLGLTIGYTPEARIGHLYLGRFGEWREFTEDFVEGQMKFLALAPGDPLTTMFDEVPEWSGRHRVRRDAARRICRMLLSDLRRSIVVEEGPHGGRLARLRPWHWRLLAGWLCRGAAGPLALQTQALLRRSSARLALRISLLRRDQAGAEKSLTRCCEAIATLQRLSFLRRWARELEHRSLNGSGSNGSPPAEATGVWRPGRLADDHGVGFHLASGAGAEAIRWSEPAAYVELPLPAGAYRISLDWLFRPPVRGTPRLRFYLDERPLPKANVRISHDHAELRVRVPKPGAPTRIGWVCSAHQARGDDRALGLPVSSLTWIPDDSSTAA